MKAKEGALILVSCLMFTFALYFFAVSFGLVPGGYLEGPAEVGVGTLAATKI